MGVGIPKYDYVGAFLWGTTSRRSPKPWCWAGYGPCLPKPYEEICVRMLVITIREQNAIYASASTYTAINFNRTLTKMAARHRSGPGSASSIDAVLYIMWQHYVLVMQPSLKCGLRFWKVPEPWLVSVHREIIVYWYAAARLRPLGSIVQTPK